MGKFLSEIKGQPVGNSGSIDFILAKLGEADGRDLIDALNDPAWRKALLGHWPSVLLI